MSMGFAVPSLDPGGVAEWSNALVLKTRVRASGPRVRIPPPPFRPNLVLGRRPLDRQCRSLRRGGGCALWPRGAPKHDRRTPRLARRNREPRASVDDCRERCRERAERVRHGSAHKRLHAGVRDANPASRLEAGATHSGGIVAPEHELRGSMAAGGGAGKTSRRDPSRRREDEQDENRCGSTKSRSTRRCSHVSYLPGRA